MSLRHNQVVDLRNVPMTLTVQQGSLAEPMEGPRFDMKSTMGVMKLPLVQLWVIEMPGLYGARLKAAFMESISHGLHRLHAMPDPSLTYLVGPVLLKGQNVKAMN